MINKTSIASVDRPLTISPADVVRPLSESLKVDSVSINYFELSPGESFGYAYHCHPEQEEIFVILRGTATFRTKWGDVDVSTGEVVRFSPGEFQQGRNDGDERVVALAIGAPADANEIEYKLECERCEDERVHVSEFDDRKGAVVITCSECGHAADEVSPSR